MDFTRLLGAVFVVAIGLFAFFGLATEWNQEYGTGIGDDLNDTSTRVQNLVYSHSENVTRSLVDESEVSSSTGLDAINSVVRQGWRAIKTVFNLPGLVADLIGDAGAALGIHPYITGLAKIFFIFAFWLAVAYLLITGIRSFIT